MEAAERFKEDNIQDTCQSKDLPRVAWRPYLNTGKYGLFGKNIMCNCLYTIKLIIFTRSISEC